jgi:hypothetical protein
MRIPHATLSSCPPVGVASETVATAAGRTSKARPAAAGILGSMDPLPPVPRGDVARRSDVERLEARFGARFARFEKLDARIEIDAATDRQRARQLDRVVYADADWRVAVAGLLPAAATRLG